MPLRRLVTRLIAVGILIIPTLKGHVFGAESDISPLCSPGGVLISDPAGKAELLSAWFKGTDPFFYPILVIIIIFFFMSEKESSGIWETCAKILGGYEYQNHPPPQMGANIYI